MMTTASGRLSSWGLLSSLLVPLRESRHCKPPMCKDVTSCFFLFCRSKVCPMGTAYFSAMVPSITAPESLFSTWRQRITLWQISWRILWLLWPCQRQMEISAGNKRFILLLPPSVGTESSEQNAGSPPSYPAFIFGSHHQLQAPP